MSTTKMMSLLCGAIALLLVAMTPLPRADAQQVETAPSAAGLVVVESTRSFDETWSALIAALDANPNIRTIATVDHGAAATSIDATLSGNRVVFFGNPNLGTPIMQANRTAGIDLPQKMQVIEHNNRVYVTYNPPSYLAARHGTGQVATFTTIEGALAGLARTATNTSGPQSGPSQTAPAAGAGLVSTPSANDFETTWTKLNAAIDASPASVAFTVDHGANSGGTLGPTRLVAFGNPNIGTPIMASSATAGIDLPLKILVFEDDEGVTHVVSTAPSFVQSRHSVGGVPTINAATGAIANFTAAATTGDPDAVPTETASTDTGSTDTASTDTGSTEAESDEVLGITELAVTGSNPVVAWGAIALIGLGTAMVVSSRRRLDT